MARDENLNIIVRARNNASSTLRAIQNDLRGTGQRAEAMGRAMLPVSLAAAGALAFAAKKSLDFESAFAGVRKTVDATEPEFKQLEQGIIAMSNTIPQSTTDLSKIMEIAGQLGVRGVDNLKQFTRTVADISVTTNLTSEEAATSFARIANIMQEPIKNVDRMGSVVVELGNNFATTEAELTAFATRIAGAAKIAGLTTPEIFGIGTAMSSVGVQAELGGTAVQKALNAMTESVATGNDQLGVFAKTAGLTADEFKTLFEKDASQAFVKFVNGLSREGNKAFTILDELGLGNERTIRAFLSLANAGDLVNRSIEAANKEWKTNTALTEEAQKRYATGASKLKIFKNRLDNLAKTFGDVIVPSLIKVTEGVEGLMVMFGNLPQPVKLVTVGVLALLAVAAPLLITFGKLTQAVFILRGGLTGLATSSASAAAGMGALAASSAAAGTATKASGAKAATAAGGMSKAGKQTGFLAGALTTLGLRAGGGKGASGILTRLGGVLAKAPGWLKVAGLAAIAAGIGLKAFSGKTEELGNKASDTRQKIADLTRQLADPNLPADKREAIQKQIDKLQGYGDSWVRAGDKIDEVNGRLMTLKARLNDPNLPPDKRAEIQEQIRNIESYGTAWQTAGTNTGLFVDKFGAHLKTLPVKAKGALDETELAMLAGTQGIVMTTLGALRVLPNGAGIEFYKIKGAVTPGLTDAQLAAAAIAQATANGTLEQYGRVPKETPTALSGTASQVRDALMKAEFEGKTAASFMKSSILHQVGLLPPEVEARMGLLEPAVRNKMAVATAAAKAQALQARLASRGEYSQLPNDAQIALANMGLAVSRGLSAGEAAAQQSAAVAKLKNTGEWAKLPAEVKAVLLNVPGAVGQALDANSEASSKGRQGLTSYLGGWGNPAGSTANKLSGVPGAVGSNLDVSGTAFGKGKSGINSFVSGINWQGSFIQGPTIGVNLEGMGGKGSFDKQGIWRPGAKGGVVTPDGIVRFAEGGTVPHMVAGGALRGIFQPRGSDTVPAMLTPDEVVVSKPGIRNAQQFLDSFNRGVPGVQSQPAPAPQYHFHFHGTVIADKMSVRKFAEEIHRQTVNIARSNRKAANMPDIGVGVA